MANKTQKPKDVNLNIQARISQLLEELTADMYERNQTMAIALLGAITGHNTFLLGPPGTAKSLISRRLIAAFESPKYFEYLMNRFSTPEEIFGPVSIKELKEDRYIRQVDDYLPTADFAFLDEIWKSSPAILNNLLTIINEHTFRNGKEIIQVPLKSLIAASNEVPPPNQGLEALYDRFVIRLFVPPIEQEENFNHLINSKPSSENSCISPELIINYDEMQEWRDKLHLVTLSDDTLLVIKYIRQQLISQSKKLDVYVSDRRWQRAAILLKASAFCNGRTETNHSDALLLKYCLWTTTENREAVQEIVTSAIENCGFDTDINLAKLDKEKDKLDLEINEELYHSEDIYDVIQLNDGRDYFKFNAVFKRRGYENYSDYDKEFELYIPFENFKTKDIFHLVDKAGNIQSSIQGSFKGQGSCEVTLSSNVHNNVTFRPNVLFNKGDKKKDINERLVSSLADSIKDIRQQLIEVSKQVEGKSTEYKQHLASPFVTKEEISVAITGVTKQKDQIQLRIADCERLEALCR
ncbi:MULTISPECIES: AAA family ATPase [unclassified Psychrobacter]|uniref:AAA family ATPase n=1 Tax=unclassified Psychrobacter TaxID=196806 RepID=UPI003F45538E